MLSAYPIDPVLVAIFLAYTNKRLIANDVLFRVPVGKQEFKWNEFAKGDSFTIPDTHVGRRSKTNEVHFGATEQTDSTKDYGLNSPIPNADIINSGERFKPVDQAVVTIANLIALDREVRVANLVFDPANYGASNKIVLSGTAQFDDFDNSDPIGVIMDALDAMIMRGNEMTLGRQVFSKIIQHPDIVKATQKNSGDKGIAQRSAVADLFELDAVHVGEALVNASKPGQAVSLSRAWGKHISIQFVDRTASTQGGTTFGYSAEWGDPVASQREDPDIGLRGGVRVEAGESLKELIVADDLGYFIEDAVS